MHATFNIAQELRAQIDEINDWVYTDVNNGVYKCGFSTTQVWLLHFFLAPTAGKHQKQILRVFPRGGQGLGGRGRAWEGRKQLPRSPGPIWSDIGLWV